jgi:hypothetical protein
MLHTFRCRNSVLIIARVAVTGVPSALLTTLRPNTTLPGVLLVAASADEKYKNCHKKNNTECRNWSYGCNWLGGE